MRIVAAIFNVVLAAIVITPDLIKYALLIIFNPGRLKNTRSKRVSEEGINHPPVEGVHHEYVLCDDVRIHIARAGMDASKKLILFVHGFPEFWYSWRSQIEALQGDYEVAAIDLPGYNASGKPDRVSRYISQDICRIVAAVLNGLARESCVLVGNLCRSYQPLPLLVSTIIDSNLGGHDWGAGIATDFAAMYPKKVTHLALLAVPPGNLFYRNMDLHQLTKSIYMWRFLVPGVMEALIAADDYKGIRKVLTVAAAGGPIRGRMSEEEADYYLDALAAPGALKSAINYYRAALWHTSVLRQNEEVRHAWKTTPRHTMPLLVLMGDSDAFVNPNCLKAIGRVAAKATVRILPDCSHWVQQDAAEDVNRLLKQLIEQETDNDIL